MTPEDVDKMEAGREMDALIAEKIMGWKWRILACGHVSRPGQYEYTRFLTASKNHERWPLWDGKASIPVNKGDWWLPKEDSYSTDIAAAWQVVEKTRLFTHCDITQVIGAWVIFNHANDSQVTADTAPLAICRAAFKAHLAAQEPQEPAYSPEAVRTASMADEDSYYGIDPQEPEGAGK